MKNKALKFFLVIIGFVFGFSSNVAAQYGIPPGNFKINGFILSEKGNTPVKDIKIKINEKKQWKTSVSTNENGEFSFNIDENDIGDTIFISVADIDGDKNGSYQPKDTIVKIHYNDIKYIKNSDIDGINKTPFNIHIKPEAIKPKDQKKTDVKQK